MKPWFLELLVKTKDSVAGKVLAILGLAVWGGGYTLSEVPLEPWGTLVQGLGAALGLAAMVVVGKAKPKEEPKP